MAAKKDDQVPEAFDDAVQEVETQPVSKKGKVVAADKADKTKQSREKSKSRNSGFVAFLRKADPIALTCFVVILLASAVVIGSYVKTEYFDDESSGTATSGSSVEVDYVGSYLAYYDQSGVIFDTNISGVANDESMIFSGMYKKSEDFNRLKFTIGGGQVLKAFGDACAGHGVGDVVRVEIAPSNITDSSDPKQSYGMVEKKELTPEKTVVKMSGTMSLDAYNRLCDTSYTADSFTEPKIDSPIKDVDFLASYDGSMVNYAFVGLSAAIESAELTTGAAVKISDVTSESFTLTYLSDKNSVLKGIVTDGDEIQSAFIEHKAGETTMSYYLDDFSDHPEQKGETMYFYIKIVSVS